MTNQDKITAIIAAIQDDAQLIILIRALVTNNLNMNYLPVQTLDMAMSVLGLPNG